MQLQPKLLFNGILEVHANGDVYRIKDGQRVPAAVCGTGRNGNYQTTSIMANGKQKPLYIHRLVAEAFIPNPEGKPQINHKDGNPKNNDVSNIEWCTPSENINHAYRTGLIQPMKNAKECHGCGILTKSKKGMCLSCRKALTKGTRYNFWTDKSINRQEANTCGA